MPQIHEYAHTVTSDEIDSLGHANNVCYVGWLQDAAVSHSTALGWPGARYKKLGSGWVVRSHKIEYLQPVRAGDELVVRTWVASMNKATSLRRYQIVRQADQAVVARAETLWAFVNYATGRPMRIAPEVAAAYPVIVERETDGTEGSSQDSLSRREIAGVRGSDIAVSIGPLESHP